MTNVQRYFNALTDKRKRRFLEYGLLRRLLLYNGISVSDAAKLMQMSIPQCKEICGRRNPFIKHSIRQLINLKRILNIDKPTSDFLNEIFELSQLHL